MKNSLKTYSPNELKLLLERIVIGKDRKAFSALYYYYVPRLNSYLQKTGIQSSVAEEIIQDVMLTIWRKSNLFDHRKSSVSTWVYRIARNRSVDFLRQNKLEFLDFELADMDVEDDLENQNDNLIEKEISIQEALNSLPEDQLELVKMSYFEGLSHIEISQRTQIPLGTVKSRIRLGFTKIKRDLLKQAELGRI